MTSCRDIQELLGPHLDGELSERDRKRVREHLDSCPDCKAEFAFLAAMDEGLRVEAGEGEPAAEHLEALASNFSQRFDLASARAQWHRPPRRRLAFPASWLPPRWSPAVRIAFVTAALAGVVIIARQVGQFTAVPPALHEQMPLPLKSEGTDAVRLPESKPPGTMSEGTLESGGQTTDAPDVIEAEKRPAGQQALEDVSTEESLETGVEPILPPRPTMDADAPPVQGSRRPPDRHRNEDRLEQMVKGPSPTMADHLRGGRGDEVMYEVDSAQLLPPGPDRGRLVGFFREILAGMGREETAEAESETGLKAAAAAPDRDEKTSVAEPSLLDAREADPSLPDSLWTRMWRVTARSLADQALQNGRLEDCQEALHAYWRVSHRAGKELAPDSSRLADLYRRDQERLDALLDCATR